MMMNLRDEWEIHTMGRASNDSRTIYHEFGKHRVWSTVNIVGKREEIFFLMSVNANDPGANELNEHA